MLDFTGLLFLGIAIVVIWRFYSVLGSRTGNERPPINPFQRRSPPPQGPRLPAAPRESDNVIRLPGPSADQPTSVASAGVVESIDRLVQPGSALNDALRTIASTDRSFDPDRFVNGAKTAYEMIVAAFAGGNRTTLKNLLAPEVLNGFYNAIDEREKRGESLTTQFIGLERTEIVEASLRGGTCHITLRFVSKLISVTRGKDGAIIDGDPQKVLEVTDVWTFARDVRSRDPNWKLIATGVDGG